MEEAQKSMDYCNNDSEMTPGSSSDEAAGRHEQEALPRTFWPEEQTSQRTLFIPKNALLAENLNRYD